MLAVRAWIAESIETRDPDTVINRFHGVKFCVRQLGIQRMDIEHLDCDAILRLKHIIGTTQARLHALVYLRLFYYWLARNGVAGASLETAELIRQVAVPEPIKGEAVLSRDPQSGPLNAEETDMIEQEIKKRLPADLGAMILMLFYELGLNPIAVSLLEERDFHVIRGPESIYYQLDVPRTKKRNTERNVVRRPLSQELGQAIIGQLERNCAHYGNGDPFRPIIPRNRPRRTAHTIGPRKFDQYVSEKYLATVLGDYAHAHDLISTRTSEVLHMHPRRLRYTYGTRLAELGTPTRELAALMDHSNEQSVLVYYKPSPKAAARIDEAVGLKAGRVWTWFKCKTPVDKPADLTDVAVVPAQTPTLKPQGGIGACGANLLCQLNPPYSCYVCPKFQPWKDAPHQALLQDVRTEQQRLREASGNNPAYPIPSALDQIERAMCGIIATLGKKSDGH